MKYSAKQNNIFLPVSMNITGKKILIVGGGRVATHKLSLLSRFTNEITILAPEISCEIKKSNFRIIQREYHSSNLEGYFLVYACTNNYCLNQKIREEAHARGLLVNVADNPELCDFVSPAIYKNGYITIAIGSNAQNVRKAIEIRDKIETFFSHGTP